MDRRGIAETVGGALVSAGLAIAGLWLFAGYVDWVLVVGLAVGVAIATAANYRARTGHAENVAAEAPDTYDSYAQAADDDTQGTAEDQSGGPPDSGTDRAP